ncbi:MAG: hypothetical protein ACYSYV_06210 [Planctomycetota bacterium]|jgi:hypothetical protein
MDSGWEKQGKSEKFKGKMAGISGKSRCRETLFEETKPILERAEWTQSHLQQGIMGENGASWLDKNYAKQSQSPAIGRKSQIRRMEPNDRARFEKTKPICKRRNGRKVFCNWGL